MIKKLEICCTSFASAKIAMEAGADRLEICDNLIEGGTTPGPGLVAKIKKELDIEINVLIRPRGGDFCYSDDEIDIIKRDILFFKELGVDGFVCGVLTPDFIIDIEKTKTLIELSRPSSFTFHRAFDLINDQSGALEQLIDLGADKILTSGGEKDVLIGSEKIAKLVERSCGRVDILAGGGLNSDNINSIIATGCREFHTTAKKTIQSFPPDASKVRMNGLSEIPENTVMIASKTEIIALRQAIDK